ncbi:MAG: RagB/SusD family nutrient uptake outer membrane protein [Alistipes sp.]|nr:RagB/SusD family nutrient uptake outer membrane protein [Alistipes sp.]
MLRNMKYAILAMTLTMSLTACLDKVPESAILEEEVMMPSSNPTKAFNEAEQVLTGIYARMMSSALWSGYLTLVPEIQADLVYAVDGYSNAYGDIWQWNIRPTNPEIEAVYASLYAVIANCNFFLERIDGVIGCQTSDENIAYLEYYMGEVYAIRALCYSELIKCFANAYDPQTAKEELGVVLRSKYSTPESSHRASLYDSYQFVIADLEQAETLLDAENDYYGAFYMTRAAACALRARVALQMQDWETAINYSSQVIDHPKKTFDLASATSLYTADMSYFDYMWSYDQAFEIILQVGYTVTSYGGALGQNFLNFNNDYTYYYPDYVPAEWVLNLYQSSDLRYGSYFASLQTGYDHGLVWPLLVKYYGNQNFMQNMIYHVCMPKIFRLAEQYLIRAEAYCRQEQPNYSLASKDLTKLRATRFQSGGGNISLTASNYIEQIANERVRELYMEGFRLWDMKRWGKLYNNGEGFTRKAQSNSLKEGSSLKVTLDNPLFTWPIPQHEIESPGSEVEPNASNK